MLKTNTYFDGKVASIALQTAELPATVGVMAVGDYQFDTQQHEVITVISGQLNVKLADQAAWKNLSDGDQFEVPAGQTFKLKVAVQTAYFCTYEDK